MGSTHGVLSAEFMETAVFIVFVRNGAYKNTAKMRILILSGETVRIKNSTGGSG